MSLDLSFLKEEKKVPKEEKKSLDLSFLKEPDYGLREDKTKKGLGYFGPIKTPDNKDMTELSIGVNFDGKEHLIPSIVPTLTYQEIEHLRKGGNVTDEIQRKAVEHARKRIAENKSPFAQEGEQSEMPQKSSESFWERLGQAGAYQAQIMPPAESLPQMIAGNLEELSLGAVDVMQPKTEGGAVMREAGKYLLAYPLMFKGLYKLFGPGGWIARIAGMGGAGGLRSAVKQYFKKGEIDPKQVGIEAATWAGLQAVGEIGATALQTKQAIDFISARTGKSKAEVARFLARTFRNKFGKKFKAEPTARNIELITQKNPEGVADVWKESVGDLEKEAQRIEMLTKPTIEATGMTKEIKPFEKEKIFEINPEFVESKTLENERTQLARPSDLRKESLKRKLTKKEEILRKREWDRYFGSANNDIYKKLYAPLKKVERPTELKRIGRSKRLERQYTPEIKLGILGDFIKGPQLRNILKDALHYPVYRKNSYDDLHFKEWGGFDRNKNRIVISGGISPASVLRSLVHEAIHGLQLQKKRMPYYIISRPFLEYLKQPHEISARKFENWVKQDVQNYRKSLLKTKLKSEELPTTDIETLKERKKYYEILLDKELKLGEYGIKYSIERYKNEIEIINKQLEKIQKSKEKIKPEKVKVLKKEIPKVEKPKLKIYRGYGRIKKETVYGGVAEPILGKGKYYAFNKEQAKKYGPQIEEKELDLKNPLEINSNQEWKKLTKEAGWRYPNLTGLPKEQISKHINDLNKLIKSKGYDGVIINWDNTTKTDVDKYGNDIDLLRNVFEIPQVYIPEGIKKPVEKKEIPKVEKPPSKPPPPEKPPVPPKEPSGEEPSSPSNMTESTNKYFSKMASKFDVEYPFKKVGAPETGFAVKNYYDRINFHIEKGKEVIKEIKKLGLTPEEASDAVLAAERDIIPKDPKVAKARELIRNYMDKSLAMLKKEGVLKQGFHQNLISGIEAKIEANKELMNDLSTRKKRKIALQNAELRKELEEVKKLRFVSIPVRELFEAHTMGRPELTRRVVKYLTKRRRKTLTIQDLVDSGAIEKNDLTPAKIISSYSKKFGRDMALAKIINAGKKEGMVFSEELPGSVKIPGYIAPELAKYYISPTFADFIKGYTNPVNYFNWEKLCNRFKGWAFYNPFILGFNNLWQHTWAVLGQPQHLAKLPAAWKQAILDVKNKTPNYWEAFENGIRSSPFVMLEKNIGELTNSLKKSGPNPLLSIMEKTLKLPKELHDKLYNAIQSMAWTGGDMVPRMATYNWLRSIGLNPRDAAQVAARYHGDYASVPAAIRRKLNKAFFTPTFPIVMTKATLDNLKSSGQVVKIMYKRAKGEKPPKIDPKTKAMSAGLLATAVILGAFHATMKSMGFDTVFPVWHYKRDYRDDEGKLRTQHVYGSFPFTTVWKHIGRAYESFTKPGVENRMLTFIKRMKITLSVPLQIAWEIFENKNRHWKEIYDPKDNPLKQFSDILYYAAKRAIPVLGIPLGETYIDPEKKEEMINEYGRLITYLPFLFTYKSKTDRQKAISKAKYVKEKANALFKKGKLTEKEKENYKKEIKKLKEVK